MKKCIFCKFYKNNQNIVYKNKFFYIRFDDFPVSPGHLEIIPVRHVVSFFDLTSSEWRQLKPTINKAINIIKKTNFKNLYKTLSENNSRKLNKKFYKKILKRKEINKKPSGYNIGVNEGKVAGRTINHLHIHIIPRYFGDVKDCVGGIRCVIPGMKNYKR